ncbi:MAG: hypothetical protein JXA74_16125 [Anaerolineae bacterium]|nr:hypothetical protein [Anaerolineae bacterium]
MPEQIPGWLLAALGVGGAAWFLTALRTRGWFTLLSLLMALLLGLGALGVRPGVPAAGEASFGLRAIAAAGLLILVLPFLLRLLPLIGGLVMMGILVLFLPEAMRYAIAGAFGITLILSGYRAVIKGA